MSKIIGFGAYGDDVVAAATPVTTADLEAAKSSLTRTLWFGMALAAAVALAGDWAILRRRVFKSNRSHRSSKRPVSRLLEQAAILAVQGATAQQVARELNVTPSSARKLLSQARAKGLT